VLRSVIRDEGLSAIVVEQKARKILGFTDRAIVLDRGRIVLARRTASRWPTTRRSSRRILA
jgi:branched-chain amino acid transport system ATP-binding protein